MTFKVGSLFSGCGGFDLGFKKAGFEIAWANDIEPNACETYRNNIGEIIEGDVTEINPKDLSPIDVLTAGFPCQPFSNAGSRKGTSDNRGQLYQSTFKFIEYHKPKIVIYENVRGFLSFKDENDKKLIDTIKEELEARDYNCTYKLVNFSHFGIPQNRIRVIFIAVRSDLVSVADKLFPEIVTQDDLSIAATLEGLTDGAANQLEIMKLNPQALHYGAMIPEGGSWKNLPYEILPERWKKIRDDMPRYHYPNFFRRYHRNDVMGTITAAFKPENAAVWHPIKGRIFSVREIARFQTFPDDFVFYGKNTKAKYQQIGNAVPPLFSQKLGERIKLLLSGGDEKSLEYTLPISCMFNVNKPMTYKKNQELIEKIIA
jgi:DNA (cytosine-5)-methyltransferase 1